VQPEGVIGLLVPSGIASDKTASEFFRGISTGGRLGALLDFENKKVFFPDIHASFKFSVFVFGGSERRFDKAHCAFFLYSVDELGESERSFPLGPEDFGAVNPNTGTAPILLRRRDAEIITDIYSRLPVLVDRRGDAPVLAWHVRYMTMFHMTNDSHLFRTEEELEEEGCYPVKGNTWKRDEEVFIPLYEGKMVQMYDHRAASVVVHPENVHRPAHPVPAKEEEHQDRMWLPTPQYWVAREHVTLQKKWTIAFKDVTAPTNERTMIAAALPAYALGNTLPAFVPGTPGARVLADGWRYVASAPLLLATLNSFAFDFVARRKIQGQHLNLYIVEQLPVVPAESFSTQVSGQRLADMVREEVLHLSYTAVDMTPFARDLGYPGEPFAWDEEDRRHRRARLDALFFHLYGISRRDADYNLNQFTGVREDDEKVFGWFRTRDLILAYMNAVAAGDLTARVRD